MRSSFFTHLLAAVPRAVLAAVSACLITACGSTNAYNGMPTASLKAPTIPAQGMVRRPASKYVPASGTGVPVPPDRSSRAFASEPVDYPGAQGFKPFQYQWNGNRERIKEGAPWKPEIQQQPLPSDNSSRSSNVVWQATPLPPLRDDSEASAHGPGRQSSRDIVVAPGDTLYQLANKHQVPVLALMKINHLPSASIRVGQHLSLPAAGR